MPTGLDILRTAENHLGEPYVYGARAPMGRPHRGPWDCADFDTHVVCAVTGRLWGCVDNTVNLSAAVAYTGAWARDAQANLSRLVLPEGAPAGAILIRAPHPSADVGGHVAIADGKGGTVEAQGARTGVCRSVVAGRRWSWALLVPGVEYGPWVAPTPPRRAILRYGSRGGDVQRLQTALGIAADGIYGRDTTRAVVAWQDAHGLTPDGEVGPLTWAALFPQEPS